MKAKASICISNDDTLIESLEIAKRYTHDTIRPISFYGSEKKVDLGFVGSCM